MLKTTSRLARVAPRAGLVRLARRQQSGLAGWASELYSNDPKFWTYTAATCGLVVTMYTLDSMSSGSKPAPHHHVEHHHTPAAAPAEEEAEPTSSPATRAVAAPPAPTAAAAAASGAPAAAPAAEPTPWPAAVGELVVAGNFSAFSDGSNVWLVETGLFPGEQPPPEGAVALRAEGKWVHARQMTDFPAGGPPPSLEGLTADAAWLLVKQRSGADGKAHLVGVPNRGTAEAPVDLTPYSSAAVGRVTVKGSEALVEVSGLAPGASAVFRAALPAASGAPPSLSLDTDEPAGGEVVEWLVDPEKLTVRGAVLFQAS